MAFSYGDIGGSAPTDSTPPAPSTTRVEKKGTPGTAEDATNEHSDTPFSPCSARSSEFTIRSPAAAMLRVADPAPSLALTTSSPPN